MGQREVHGQTQDGGQAAGGQAPGSAGYAEASPARSGCKAGPMAGVGGEGLPQLPRCPRQPGQREGVPHAVDTSLALCVATQEPQASIAVEAIRPTGRQMDSQCPDTAPVSQRAILRQAPEVGAVCGNSARTDLCGGPGATRGPTATDFSGFTTCLAFWTAPYHRDMRLSLWGHRQKRSIHTNARRTARGGESPGRISPPHLGALAPGVSPIFVTLRSPAGHESKLDSASGKA